MAIKRAFVIEFIRVDYNGIVNATSSNVNGIVVLYIKRCLISPRVNRNRAAMCFDLFSYILCMVNFE